MLSKLELVARWMLAEPLYLDAGPRREFIASVVSKYAEHDDTIIEIGCNAGSNLVPLYEAGFRDLGGIDISARAIEKASERIPRGIFIRGDLSDAIKQIPKADVLFSMAVLMHISPDDEMVFQSFHEHTRYLITCEWERTSNNYIVARDYGAVFSEHFEQVEIADNLEIDGITGYTLRVFKVRE